MISFFDMVDEAVILAMEGHGPDGHIDGHELIAAAALDAIPEGMAKLDGEWIDVRAKPARP